MKRIVVEQYIMLFISLVDEERKGYDLRYILIIIDIPCTTPVNLPGLIYPVTPLISYFESYRNFDKRLLFCSVGLHSGNLTFISYYLLDFYILTILVDLG